MLNYRRFAAFLLIALSLVSLARGTLYKCQDREGRVTLRDERCRDGERTVVSVRPGDVTRNFTVIAPPVSPPAPAPAPAQSGKGPATP